MKLFTPDEFKVSDNAYHINGKEYVRVTATLNVISKQRLLNWVKKVGRDKANKILASRQTVGIVIHKLIENILNGESVPLYEYESEIQKSINKFYMFKDAAKLKPVALEQPIWSNIFGYAGTIDYVGYYKSPLKFFKRKKPKFLDLSYVIIDWKTSKGIYEQYGLQVAAYAQAFTELTGKKVDGAVIVLFRDGVLRFKEYTKEELDDLFEIYKAVLTIYRWKYKK